MAKSDFLRNHQIPNRVFNQDIDAIRFFSVDPEGRESFISYFGENLSTERRIVADVKAYYGLSGIDTESSFQNVLAENGNFMFNVTSTGLDAEAFIESKEVVRYVSSTVFYSTFSVIIKGINGNQETNDVNDQVVFGLLSNKDGFGLGFIDGKFSFIRRKGGENVQVIPCEDFVVNICDFVDFSKINVFRIVSSWHAAGPVVCSLQTEKGKWINFLTVDYNNRLESPQIGVPNLPVRIEMKSPQNTGAGFSLVAMSSGELGPESQAGLKGFSRSNERETTGINDLTTLIYLKNKSTFRSLENSIAARLDFLSLAADGNRPMRFAVILNPTIADEGTLNDVNTNESVMEISLNAGNVTPNSGIRRFGATVSREGQLALPISFKNILIAPNESLALVASSNNNNLASVNLGWEEFY